MFGEGGSHDMFVKKRSGGNFHGSCWKEKRSTNSNPYCGPSREFVGTNIHLPASLHVKSPTPRSEASLAARGEKEEKGPAGVYKSISGES